MKTANDLAKEIQQKAGDIASQMDYSRMDTRKLLSAHWQTYAQLDCLKSEIFDWAPHAESVIRENPELVKRCVDIAWKAVLIAVHLLAVRLATLREIEGRSRKNKTNYYFGLLKLAHDFGFLELQKKAWGQLRGILLAIPYKKGWFHPSEGKEGWLGVIDEALAEQLKKYAELDGTSTLERMTENGFAYVYRAVEERLIDEVRRLGRRPRATSVGDRSVFDSVPVPPTSSDESPQRLAVIKLARDLGSRHGEGEAGRTILEQISEFFEDLEELGPLSVAEIRAHVVKKVALNRGVSEQQARKDVNNFAKVAQTEQSIRYLADEIRALGTEEEKLVLTLREVQEEEEDDAIEG